MRSLQASDQMADNRLGAIYFRQLEVGTVGQVGSNLGSGQDNFPAIKDNYYKITLDLFYHFWKMLFL
jgi:hypothetical protein